MKVGLPLDWVEGVGVLEERGQVLEIKAEHRESPVRNLDGWRIESGGARGLGEIQADSRREPDGGGFLLARERIVWVSGILNNFRVYPGFGGNS